MRHCYVCLSSLVGLRAGAICADQQWLPSGWAYPFAAERFVGVPAAASGKAPLQRKHAMRDLLAGMRPESRVLHFRRGSCDDANSASGYVVVRVDV